MFTTKSSQRKRRVFVAFAIEDEDSKILFVGQAKNVKVPFEFIDMSVKEPYTDSWKTQCRTKIKGCDGMIALISSNTASSSGELWEMKCAAEEGVALLGVYAYNYEGKVKPAKPAELGANPLVAWSWDAVADFIDGL